MSVPSLDPVAYGARAPKVNPRPGSQARRRSLLIFLPRPLIRRASLQTASLQTAPSARTGTAGPARAA